MDVHSISALDPMFGKGDLMLGWTPVATGILFWTSRSAPYFWKVLCSRDSSRSTYDRWYDRNSMHRVKYNMREREKNDRILPRSAHNTHCPTQNILFLTDPSCTYQQTVLLHVQESHGNRQNATNYGTHMKQDRYQSTKSKNTRNSSCGLHAYVVFGSHRMFFSQL
jgi:hypothetical protein